MQLRDSPRPSLLVVQMVERLRTTAESHHRIAVVEVMGRQSGYIALGAAYAQPDIILIPEVPVDPQQLTQQVSRIYDQQQNVVIVVGEGVRGWTAVSWGQRRRHSTRRVT
jgi:6-phosphofructokinase 1